MAKITLTLDTSNNQKIEAKTSELTILVLGEIKTENLDSLSVTLKVSKNGTKLPPICTSIDLYRDEHVEEFVNTICKKLEIGFSNTQSSIYELIEKLETYRFELSQSKNQSSESNPLNSKEKQSAKRYLGKKNFIESIKEDLEKAGIYSNVNEALVTYISICSIKLDNPLSICLLDDSDTSKKIFDVLHKCTPNSEIMYPSVISSQALYYLGLEDFKHKSLMLSNFGKKDEIYDPLHQLITNKRLKKIVALKDKSGLPYTMAPEVEGPIAFCAFAKKKYQRKLQKLPLLNIPLEYSVENIQKWIYRDKMKYAGQINPLEVSHAQERLIHLQGVLQPIQVVNPFAIDIELPYNHKDNGGLLLQLLNIIKTITFLNQFKREQYVQDAFGNPCQPYIKTTISDIELAFELIQPVLDTQPELLNTATQSFYEFLCQWLLESNKDDFYAYQLRQHNPSLHQRSLNRYLKELTQNGLIEISGGKKHSGYSYSIKEKDYQPNNQESNYSNFVSELIETLKSN